MKTKLFLGLVVVLAAATSGGTTYTWNSADPATSLGDGAVAITLILFR